MGLKSRMFGFIVRHNLLPVRIRWRKYASGVGRLYNDVFHLIAEDERYRVIKVDV